MVLRRSLFVLCLAVPTVVMAQQVPGPGQQPMAGSLPVVVASDQTPIPVTGAFLIAGFSLAATQTDRTQKTQITDGTRDGTVKAASTVPLATDTALVVTLRESLLTSVNWNGTAPPIGAGTEATALRVTLATDSTGQTKLTTGTAEIGNVKNSGTFAVQASTKTALTANPPVALSVGVASAQAIASNASRKSLVCVNTSSNNISLGIAAAAVLNSGITLAPWGSWSMNEYSFATGAINGIASGAASNLSCQEFQ